MSHKSLTLQNIVHVDHGRVALAFNDATRRLLEDIRDRPHEKKARKIEFVVEMAPRVHNEQGVLEGCNVQFKIKDSVPKRQTTIYPMKMSSQGLLFEPESPDEPDQMPLSDSVKVDPTTGEVIE